MLAAAAAQLLQPIVPADDSCPRYLSEKRVGVAAVRLDMIQRFLADSMFGLAQKVFWLFRKTVITGDYGGIPGCVLTYFVDPIISMITDAQRNQHKSNYLSWLSERHTGELSLEPTRTN